MNSISFFVPAYNCSATIKEAVESIIATNMVDGDELIVVNDYSTDDTGTVLANLEKLYPQIRIINHIINKGGAAARNTAVEAATHELLFCLDSDNVLAPNSISLLLGHLLEHKAEIASFSELKYFSTTTDTIDGSWHFDLPMYNINHVLSGKLFPGASGNYLFTKNSWQKANGYSEDMGALDTWSFGAKQLFENCKMVVLPGSFYFHRRGHDSYYIRDAWNKRKSVSLRLIKLIIAYIDHIHPADVDYIFSKKGRYSWFDNLDKRPIRVVDNSKATKVWAEHTLKVTPLRKMNNRIGHYRSRLSHILKRK
ncbi:glycosyltransferase family 2 protein [Mucilaginibacter boryungensis]|uniref:Glycosyltransferase family 2 protein n=1 Tax=Mucilaginibacter boryungensis TaxID=768480 RepID=A0ABR9XFQ8_9SPHI|nr:glycosyltransferase family 2 protein [Mucilaginibacter boryungensis]MBE9666007.1 glycosyltransferase family 2 protein [Mucilaginibacter boryungensis]